MRTLVARYSENIRQSTYLDVLNYEKVEEDPVSARNREL